MDGRRFVRSQDKSRSPRVHASTSPEVTGTSHQRALLVQVGVACLHWMLADLSFPIAQIGERTCPASSCTALMEAVRLATRQVPKIARQQR